MSNRRNSFLSMEKFLYSLFIFIIFIALIIGSLGPPHIYNKCYSKNNTVVDDINKSEDLYECYIMEIVRSCLVIISIYFLCLTCVYYKASIRYLNKISNNENNENIV